MTVDGRGRQKDMKKMEWKTRRVYEHGIWLQSQLKSWRSVSTPNVRMCTRVRVRRVRVSERVCICDDALILNKT